MRAILCALSVLTAMLTTQAQAQAQAANCNAQWSQLNDLLIKAQALKAPIPGLIRDTADGGCRINGVRFPADGLLIVKADSLRWSGRDLDRFATDGLPPTALQLELTGVTVSPELDDPVFNYLRDIQARGQSFDLSVNLDWDQVQKQLNVRRVRLHMPEDDFVEFSAQFNGVDLTSENSMQTSVGSFQLMQSTLTVRSMRLFQDYVLFPIGSVVLGGAENPAAKVNDLKAQAQAAINQAPGDVLPLKSKSALTQLIDDLPDPSGTLIIEQSANPGIGPARFIPLALRGGSIDTADDLWQLMDGVTFAITYDKF